jgi:hypothetical protein
MSCGKFPGSGEISLVFGRLQQSPHIYLQQSFDHRSQSVTVRNTAVWSDSSRQVGTAAGVARLCFHQACPLA